MANRLQLRKGTTAQNTAFTGAIGELTYDTQKKQLRVHDGSTVGGKSILDPIDTTDAVTQATETIAGKAKIATTAIAQAGTNDTDIMTPAKVGLVSFGQGQTRKSVTLVNNVSYTNPTNKPIVLNYVLASNVGGNTAVTHNFHVGDFVMKAEELSGTTGYRFTYTQIVLPNETYKLEMLNGPTYIVSAWEIS